MSGLLPDGYAEAFAEDERQEKLRMAWDALQAEAEYQAHLDEITADMDDFNEEDE